MIDATADKVRKHFRCPTCGYIVFDYYGSVKLIMNGFYDHHPDSDAPPDVAAFIDGKEIDWFETVGVPYPIVCAGRLVVREREDNRMRKIRCKATIYKIGV